MLKGDLTTTPIEIALGTLADEQATGCLHVVDDDGSEALIYLKSGLIYAVSVPGQRPQLGARLISSNALVPENLAEALEAQRTELQGWRLGELLVHLGFVEQDVVEAFVHEQVRDGFTDLMAWTSGRWRFRKAEKTREDVAPPTRLAQLLDEVRSRQSVWDEIVTAVQGPHAVPMLAARGGEANITLDSDTWSLLCKIDGERSIADLARECGFTLFEAGAVVRALVEAGLVDVEEDLGPDGDSLYFDQEIDALSARSAPAVPPLGNDDVDDVGADVTDESAEADDNDPVQDSFPRTAALAAAFALGGRADAPKSEQSHSRKITAQQPITVEELHEWGATASDEDAETSTLAQVSEALTRALGPRPESANSFVDPFHVPEEIRLRPTPQVVAAPAEVTEDQLRRDRIRQAASAELAAAHAEAEAQHIAEKGSAKPDHIAQVVDLEARREAARAEGVRRETERIDTEWIAAEEAARLEAERREAERIEAERLEAERIEAERLEAEEAARLEAERIEAERLEAERLAAEEAARLEAERLEAERLAAEETARLEAERIEAERLEAEETARLEAERLEAERLEAEETARLEAERIEADEAARLEAERIEAERIEAERIEAERIEAERLEAEEAARLEAERLEAERLAAEETARLEAERLEVERLEADEAARLEAERIEAERIAAEETARLEAERLEAEETARLEAERLEAERVAAEEAARLETERIETERLEAERLAANSHEQLEADRLQVEREAREQFAAAQLAAEEAAQREAERQAREAAEHAESERIAAVNQMMAQASAPTSDPTHFATATAMLSELSRNGATTLASPESEATSETAQEPEYEPAAQSIAPRDLADTASLLRELSSLGFEDVPPTSSGSRPGGQGPGASAPRPVTAAAQKKKRGLFGR